MEIGDQVKVRVPKSYKYSKEYQGKIMVGTITDEFKKSYEVTIWYPGGVMCVYLKKGG